MQPSTRHIHRFLHRNHALAALLRELERRDALLTRVRSLLPASVARHCTQAALEEGRLTLICDSPAWVDRLRFLSPQFLPALAEAGEAVSECRVRAQPGPAVATGPGLASGRGPRGSGSSPEAAQALEQAAGALGDTPLAASLCHLAETLRRG